MGIQGAGKPKGLSLTGLDTEVTLTDSGWTAIPATALCNRVSILIQNQSTVDIKTNFSNSVGYVGLIIPPRAVQIMDIDSCLTIYGRSSSGNATVLVREVA